jgi:hypothetical protein
MTAPSGVFDWLRALPDLEACFFQPHHETGFLLDAAPEAIKGVEAGVLKDSGTEIENIITDVYFEVPTRLWPGTTLRLRSYAGGAYAGTVTVIATARSTACERVFVAIIRGNGAYDDLVARIGSIIAATVSPKVLLEVKKHRRAGFPIPFRFRCNGALATDYANVAFDRITSVRRAQGGSMVELPRPFGLNHPAVIEVEWAGLGKDAGEAALRRIEETLKRHSCRFRPKQRRKVLDLLNTPDR